MYVCVIVPTKEHTDKLHATFDLDNWKLDREEFVLLAAVLENSRRASRSRPLSRSSPRRSAARDVARLAAIPRRRRRQAAVVATAPASLEPLLATAATATTLAAATCVAILVPFALSFTDELYVLRAGAKTARAPGGAPRR